MRNDIPLFVFCILSFWNIVAAVQMSVLHFNGSAGSPLVLALSGNTGFFNLSLASASTPPEPTFPGLASTLTSASAPQTHTFNIPSDIPYGIYDIQAANSQHINFSDTFIVDGIVTNTSITTLTPTITSSSLKSSATGTIRGGVQTQLVKSAQLSDGAKAAIGVGSTFGFFILIGGFTLFYFLGRRVAARNQSSIPDPDDRNMIQKSELGTDGPRRASNKLGPPEMEGGMTVREFVQLHAGERHELEARRGVSELE